MTTPPQTRADQRRYWRNQLRRELARFTVRRNGKRGCRRQRAK